MKRQLQKIATQLGMGRGLKPFSDLYNGGAVNTFGHPQNSMWTLTIQLTPNNLVRGVEVHSTYFKPSAKVSAFNERVNFKNPVTIEQAIKIAAEC